MRGRALGSCAPRSDLSNAPSSRTSSTTRGSGRWCWGWPGWRYFRRSSGSPYNGSWCGSSRVSRLCMGVGVGDLDLPVPQRRRGREARDLQDLLFVEGFPLQQGPGERVEFLAVFGQEPPCLVVALAYDPDHFFVYGTGGLLAVGLLPTVTARSAQVR